MSLEGRTFGEFTLREKIGEGGFAVVHRAYQPALEREAVVKLLHSQLAKRPDVIQRFLREARLASRLDHPYAAHVYAFGAETDGTLWIAMELVRGTPMDKLLESSGPIAIDRFVPLFERLCEVVHTAHEHNIVHRDLKPGNVMVMTRAGRMLPKLLDLGIARLLDDVHAPASSSDTTATDPRTTREGAVVGSPLYMAPEQWADAGAVGPATDIYALGVLAYEALSGRPPFLGSLNQVMQSHAREPAPPLGDGFAGPIDAAIARAMAKRPGDRYATAVDFAAALRGAAGMSGDEVLPQLDDPVRDAMAAGAPQPLAEAVAALEAARNIDQACAVVLDVVAVVARWVGILALASRTRIGPGGDADATDVRELLRELGRDGLDDEHWLALARALTRPFARRRDAYPIPDLVALLHGTADLAETPPEAVNGDPGPPFVDAFHKLRVLRTALDRRAGRTDEQRRDLYSEALAALAELLRPLRFLLEYTVVVPRRGRCERWRGLRRKPRPAVIRRARPLPDGAAVLLDVDGDPVLQLAPLIQVGEPAPGKDDELFVFDGRGPDGARLVAIPHGFERHDPALGDWFRDHLFDTLDGSDAAIRDVDGAPYRGLAAFTASDAATYFGREREVEAFVNRLRVEPVLAVVGPSGAGKSSFVQAGVVPRLPTGWRAVVIRPGPSPIAALEARLHKHAVDARDVAGDREALARALRDTAAREGSTIVVVIDQLEELFTLCHDDGERQAYAAALADAARADDDPVRVVVTLRDDFLMRAETLIALRDRVARGLKLLATPAPDDLERILVEPARRAGYRFEDAALARDMVAEVSGQPGALALLSFTAAELWKLRDRHFHQITRKAYAAIGGVGGALARHAEDTLAEMSPDEQRLAREAFRHLVTADGTRQVLTATELDQLLGGGARADAVVDRLIAARLLVASEEAGGDRRIEVIHEALLVAWPRLVEWRREDAEGARLRDQLRTAARQWDQRGRPKGLLWRGDALAEYRIWRARYPGAITDVEDAFGTASTVDATRGKRIRRGLVIAAFAILAAGLTIMFQLRQRAEDQGRLATLREAETRDQLIQNFEERGRQALLDGNPTDALALLSEAFDMGSDRPSIRFMIARALEPLDAEHATLGGHTKPLMAIAFSPDGEKLMTAAEDGTVRLWSARDGAELRRIDRAADGWLLAAWSPDGNRIAIGDSTGAVVTERVDGSGRNDLVANGAPITAMAFDPAGRRLAVGSDDGRARVWESDGTLRLDAVVDATGFEHLAFDPSGTRLVAASNAGTPVVLGIDGERLELVGHTNRVWYTRFDSDGRRIATTGIDGTARLWDAKTGRSLRVLTGHVGRVTDVAFAPDGRHVATAGADRNVLVWDVVDPASPPPAILRGHSAQVNRVLFTDAGLVSVGGDGTARVWDPGRGLLLAMYWHGGFIFDASVSPDGRYLATASWRRTGKVWALERGEAIRRHIEAPTGREQVPAFARRSRRVVTASEGVASIVELASGERHELAIDARVSAVGLAADERTVVIGDERGRIHVFDAASRSRRSVLDGELGPAHCAVADGEARRVVTCGEHGFAIVDLRAGTSTRVDVPIAPAQPEETFAVFIDGDRFVAFAPGEVFTPVIVTVAGATVATLSGHRGEVNGVVVSPDRRYVASVASDGGRIWTADGRLVAALAHDARVGVARWTPSGALVTGANDGSLAIWRPPFASPERVEAHDNYIAAVEVSPDEDFIFTVGGDRRISVWDADSLIRVMSYPTDAPVRWLFVDDGGRELVSIGRSHIDVWSVAMYAGRDLGNVACRTLREVVNGRVVDRPPC